VLRLHVAEYVDRFTPPLRVRGVLAQIDLCRTWALGGQRFECKDCGSSHAAYHSCGQRHCPLCRGAARADWQQRMQATLLPTAYFQGVFTIPKQLSSLTLGNRRPLINLLFRAAGESFRELMAAERRIEAAPQLVLHTWDQRMESHVHVHLLHPAGGPSGLHRVRYYGGLHPSKRKAYQARCRMLLGEPPAGEEYQDESSEPCEDPPSEMALIQHQLQQGICPDCGGRLDVTWSRIERPSWADVLNSPSAPAWYLGNRL